MCRMDWSCGELSFHFGRAKMGRSRLIQSSFINHYSKWSSALAWLIRLGTSGDRALMEHLKDLGWLSNQYRQMKYV